MSGCKWVHALKKLASFRSGPNSIELRPTTALYCIQLNILTLTTRHIYMANIYSSKKGNADFRKNTTNQKKCEVVVKFTSFWVESGGVCVTQWGRAEAEHVETRTAFPQRKFPIYLCQWSMLLGSTAACVHICVCIRALTMMIQMGCLALTRSQNHSCQMLLLLNVGFFFFFCKI